MGQMYMMSLLKGLLLFGISMGAAACFDPPEYPFTPEIGFEDIYFREAKAVGESDALVLTISFKDGDGNVGLSSTAIDPPYHDVNFYLASGGELIELKKRSVYSQLPQLIEVPPNVTGKLATVRTPDDPLYNGLIPSYVDAHTSCTYYSYTKLYVSETDKHIFDKTYDYDSLMYANIPKIYTVEDTFYYQKNPNYSNIDVEFWVKDGDQYKLFDWEKEFCTISFNQRFTVLSDKDRPLSGSLQYEMVTSGMKSIFGSKTLKLRVRIRDRSLNNSNSIETPDFTLD